MITKFCFCLAKFYLIKTAGALLLSIYRFILGIFVLIRLFIPTNFELNVKFVLHYAASLMIVVNEAFEVLNI